MKTSGIIGKKIVAVRQERVQTNYDAPVYHVECIELEDGSCIFFDVEELHDKHPGYAVTGTWRSSKEMR